MNLEDLDNDTLFCHLNEASNELAVELGPRFAKLKWVDIPEGMVNEHLTFILTLMTAVKCGLICGASDTDITTFTMEMIKILQDVAKENGAPFTDAEVSLH